MPAALPPRLLEERLAVARQAVVGDERRRDLQEELRIGRLPPEAPLEPLERVRPLRLRRAVLSGRPPPGHDLPVQEELARRERQGDRELRELHGDVVERARKERHPRSRLVRVGPDPVELLLDREARKLRDDLRRILDRTREHEPDRMKEPERDLVKARVPRRDGSLPDVSAIASRSRDGLPVRLERPRDRLLDGQDVRARPQPPGQSLDEILRLDRRSPPQQLLDRLLLLRRLPDRSKPAQRVLHPRVRPPPPAPPPGGGGGSGGSPPANFCVGRDRRSRLAKRAADRGGGGGPPRSRHNTPTHPLDLGELPSLAGRPLQGIGKNAVSGVVLAQASSGRRSPISASGTASTPRLDRMRAKSRAYPCIVKTVCG